MTVSYSLDVAKARFCGFAQLLGRWKGGIYKIIWREFLLFCLVYTVLSATYRCYLDEEQKIMFEKVVIFVETFTDLIPLSFVLGFYVSLVIGRWWSQYETIPWPDRLAFTIASYVQGNDDRSRTIRRTLARYVILAKVLTYQAVSTSVKRRFPTTQHLVAAGIMTQAEKCVYEKVSFPYGKWWLPLHWFTSLATRARKEGRIRDSVLLNGLFKEILDFRTSCAIMFGYDWISVPLVYTQVVTIATYMYSISLVVGRQYLDPQKGYPNHDVDLYIPFFTLLQFFFYIGWLKVAEQILNPYGEDDDDFELNWCLDRAVHLSYLAVDHLRMKHPKLEKDYFWDEMEPVLPQTKESAFFSQPQLGSAFYLNVEEADYLPMDSLFEEDEEHTLYSSDSVKGSRNDKRPSLLRRILSSGFGQRNRSLHKSVKKRVSVKGFLNKAFDDKSGSRNVKNTTNHEHMSATRAISLNNAAIKNSPPRNRTSSASFRPNSLTGHRRKTYELQEIENLQFSNKNLEQEHSNVNTEELARTASAPTVTGIIKIPVSDAQVESKDNCLESNVELNDDFMAAIPEETSRAASLASITTSTSKKERNPLEQLDAVHNLVEDANRMLLDLKRSISTENNSDIEIVQNCESYSLANNDGDYDERVINLKPESEDVENSEISVIIEMGKHEQEQKT